MTLEVDQWLAVDTLYDGTGAPPRHHRAVGIAGDRIVAEVATEELATDAPVRTIEDSALAPGLIDAHVHLLFSCDTDHERTRGRFETSDDATLTAIGEHNVAECLLGGITTVRDLGDTRNLVIGLRNRINADTLTGPRILSAGAPLTTPSGHLHWCGNGTSGDDGIVSVINGLADAGADVVKIMTSGGNMTRESDPFRAQFGDAEVELAVRTAHARGLPVAAHAQNVASIRGAVLAGVDTIEHCLWRESDGTPADPAALVALLKNSASTVVLTLAGIQRALVPGAAGFTDAERDAALAISPTGDLSTDFSWAQKVQRAGIPVVVASDAGVRFTPFRNFIDSIHAAMIALDCTVAEAIAMSTSLAADALGLGDRVGRIRPGLQADLVVFSGASSQRLGAVRDVFRSGAQVVADGQLQ